VTGCGLGRGRPGLPGSQAGDAGAVGRWDGLRLKVVPGGTWAGDRAARPATPKSDVAGKGNGARRPPWGVAPRPGRWPTHVRAGPPGPVGRREPVANYSRGDQRMGAHQPAGASHLCTSAPIGRVNLGLSRVAGRVCTCSPAARAMAAPQGQQRDTARKGKTGTLHGGKKRPWDFFRNAIGTPPFYFVGNKNASARRPNADDVRGPHGPTLHFPPAPAPRHYFLQRPSPFMPGDGDTSGVLCGIRGGQTQGNSRKCLSADSLRRLLLRFGRG